MLQYIFSGFVVKLITGLDDTLTQIPIAASITRSRFGRTAFSVGVFLAVSVAILISLGLATLIRSLAYAHYIAAGLVFFLAFLLYRNGVIVKPKKKAKKNVEKIRKKPPTRKWRLLRIAAIGFVVAFATIIDDSIAYSSLFLGSLPAVSFAIVGILIATIVQLIVLIYFSKAVTKIPYKREVTIAALVVLGMLILAGVL